MVGAETASTAGTSLWDSAAPDRTRATDVVPSPNPRCLPGWSRALPTLQEWGSTVVATTHLACALSLSRCLTPSDCAHMARTCLLVIWTSATCTAYHASPVSPVSLGIVLSPHMQVVFALFWCLLGQVLPLVSDRMTPCPINPSLSVLGSDQASLCLARAFLSPWGGRGNDVIASYQKKKEMRMLVHCPIYFAFSITMLWCVHQGNCSFFPHCRSIYYVACRCLCGLLHPKKKKPHTRDAPATPLHCRQWSNQILFSCGALLAVQDGLRFGVRVSGRFLRSAVFLCLA